MSVRTQWVFFATHAKPSSMRRAVARRLAEQSRVVVITEALSLVRERRWPALEKRMTASAAVPGLLQYMPVHYPERLPAVGEWLKERGVRMLAAELDQALAPAAGERRIVCYDSPAQHHLVGRLREDVSVYLAVDDRTVTVEGEAIMGEAEGERKLLGKVDRVICVSAPLAAALRSRVPAGRDLRIDVLANGYDETVFDPGRRWKEPAALQSVPRPRVLVAGHVSERIDWHGILGAAASRSEWSWIFLGPADAGMARRIAEITAASGARLELHGPVPHEEVAAWIAHCDACAIPYRLNRFTRASSPLKAVEYLGAGAPVLATDIPALRPFARAIAWVSEADGASYASALDTLHGEGRSPAAVQRRTAAVQGETWQLKARAFAAQFEA